MPVTPPPHAFMLYDHGVIFSRNRIFIRAGERTQSVGAVKGMAIAVSLPLYVRHIIAMSLYIYIVYDYTSELV